MRFSIGLLAVFVALGADGWAPVTPFVSRAVTSPTRLMTENVLVNGQEPHYDQQEVTARALLGARLELEQRQKLGVTPAPAVKNGKTFTADPQEVAQRALLEARLGMESQPSTLLMEESPLVVVAAKPPSPSVSETSQRALLEARLQLEQKVKDQAVVTVEEPIIATNGNEEEKPAITTPPPTAVEDVASTVTETPATVAAVIEEVEIPKEVPKEKMVDTSSAVAEAPVEQEPVEKTTEFLPPKPVFYEPQPSPEDEMVEASAVSVEPTEEPKSEPVVEKVEAPPVSVEPVEEPATIEPVVAAVAKTESKELKLPKIDIPPEAVEEATKVAQQIATTIWKGCSFLIKEGTQLAKQTQEKYENGDFDEAIEQASSTMKAVMKLLAALGELAKEGFDAAIDVAQEMQKQQQEKQKERMASMPPPPKAKPETPTANGVKKEETKTEADTEPAIPTFFLNMKD